MAQRTRKSWPPEELFPKAELLAFLLMANENVTGAALTGSLARKEQEVHDIDLVVLHNGELGDGWHKHDPPTDGPIHDIRCNVGKTIGQFLDQAREDVPVSYCFVREQALWDCRYLQSLAEGERFPGIYLTIFCQVPLFLLTEPRRGGIQHFTNGLEAVLLSVCELNREHYGIPLRHRCGEHGCQPKQPWEMVQKAIRERKANRASRSTAAGPTRDARWDASLDDGT